MTFDQRKSVLSYIPGYTQNAVLQLIIFSSGAYVVLGLVWGILFLLNQNNGLFQQFVTPYIALPAASAYPHHWWTLFTYGWFQYPNSFWELLSNMVWLYCFGSVVQVFVGHRQVIPIYIYGLVAGGSVYLLAQLLPGTAGKIPESDGILGARAGLMAMTAAAVTISPLYRLYFTRTFSVPILVVAGIFAFLMLLGTHFYAPLMLMLAAGAASGFLYIRLLRSGSQPGKWMYRFTGGIASLVTPNESALAKKKVAKKGPLTQDRVDAILDKINQKGYNSLSAEEREILLRAGKE